MRLPSPVLAALGAVLVALLLLGADHGGGVVAVPAATPIADPPLQRVEVAPDARRTLAVGLTSPVDARLLAIETDCRCLLFAPDLPLALPAGVRVEIPCTAVGVLQGLKTVVFRTTAGDAQAQVHVVGAGLGDGIAVLRGLATRAARERLEPWFLVHDLRGLVRNCGCSSGSLGGIDHLAALPAAWTALAPGQPARFILSGDIEGPRGGVAEALRTHGWTVADGLAVVSAADPAAAIADARTVVVVAPRRTVNHRKLVVPLMDGGAVVEIALVAPDGVREVVHLPVDATLPVEPAALARFRAPLTARLATEAQPSGACVGCHGTVHDGWGATRHARAWTSLAEADRTDDCAGCHSTPLADGAIAPGVHCQACHTGSDAHAAAAGGVAPTGLRDCRTCHDSRHHPSFRREEAWPRIAH